MRAASGMTNFVLLFPGRFSRSVAGWVVEGCPQGVKKAMSIFMLEFMALGIWMPQSEIGATLLRISSFAESIEKTLNRIRIKGWAESRCALDHFGAPNSSLHQTRQKAPRR